MGCVSVQRSVRKRLRFHSTIQATGVAKLASRTLNAAHTRPRSAGLTKKETLQNK
jgi:hypothetical protein